MTVADLTPFQRGWVEGLWAYCWWEHGTAMVGTTGTTFQTALTKQMINWGYSAEQAHEVWEKW